MLKQRNIEYINNSKIFCTYETIKGWKVQQFFKKTFSAMSIRLKYVKTNCTEDVLKCKPNYKTVVTYFFKPIIQFFIEIIAMAIYMVFYKLQTVPYGAWTLNNIGTKHMNIFSEQQPYYFVYHIIWIYSGSYTIRNFKIKKIIYLNIQAWNVQHSWPAAYQWSRVAKNKVQ